MSNTCFNYILFLHLINCTLFQRYNPEKKTASAYSAGNNRTRKICMIIIDWEYCLGLKATHKLCFGKNLHIKNCINFHFLMVTLTFYTLFKCFESNHQGKVYNFLYELCN